MSLRSPLGRVLGHGSAKDGTGHFWAQRVSAMALVLLGLWFTWQLAIMSDFSHAETIAFIRRPLNAVLLMLLTMTMAYHSYLGMQVVIEDYVHSLGRKTLGLIVSRFGHTFFAVAAGYAVLRIGLSA